MVVGTQVEEAVIETLKTWMPTYMKELERQLGRQQGKIAPIKTYTTRNEFTSFPNDILPLCVVASPGLAEAPTKTGDGDYNGWFAIGVGFAAVAATIEDAAFLSKGYAAAGRAILLHRQGLGGVAQKVEWMDESYDDLVTEDDRSVRAAYNVFRVLVYDIVREYAGPAQPDVDPADPANQPGSTWPTANTVEIDAINVS
jgi:hypothetical protein